MGSVGPRPRHAVQQHGGPNSETSGAPTLNRTANRSEQTGGSRRRFPLLRNFSVASLMVIVVTAVALGLVYRYTAVDLLMAQAERSSQSFATLLSHVLHEEVAAMLRPSQGRGGSARQPVLIDTVVRSEAEHFNAAKVKIYAPDGTVVYSTQPSDVGDRHALNAAVTAALRGETTSSIVYREQFNAFDRVIEHRNLLQTYLPVVGREGDRIIGVFELYTDITALLVRVMATERAVMGGVAAIMLALYAVLFLIVRRADRIIAQQGRELEAQLREIHRSNLALEGRVRSRTAELEDANARLVAEMKEREQAEQELAAARQQAWQQDKLAAIGRLAAGIVHEIGNPLAGLRGLVDTAAEALDAPEPSPARSTLAAIRDHIERMEAITRDVSDFAMPESGAPEPLSLNELLTRVVNVLRFDTKFSRFQLEPALDHDLPAISGYPDQLWLLVMNLVLNAADGIERKAGASPTITLTTSRLDDSAVLLVRDEGIGMDEQAIATAFEPFQARQPVGERVGLGLSLCYSIVQHHLGTIGIESVQARGTTVRVTLPLAPPSGA